MNSVYLFKIQQSTSLDHAASSSHYHSMQNIAVKFHGKAVAMHGGRAFKIVPWAVVGNPLPGWAVTMYTAAGLLRSCLGRFWVIGRRLGRDHARRQGL
jgi:hypothetical protein